MLKAEQSYLVVIEFKKGTVNPDVRKVIAQPLDYGSAQWGTDVRDLEGSSKDRKLESPAVGERRGLPRWCPER